MIFFNEQIVKSEHLNIKPTLVKRSDMLLKIHRYTDIENLKSERVKNCALCSLDITTSLSC